MSARPRDEAWTYRLAPPGVEIAWPHIFDMQSDRCAKCKASVTDLEDGIVSYECTGYGD